MKYSATNRFLKDFKNLDKVIQEKTKEAILALTTDRFYPGLKTKKVQNIPKFIKGDIWEARVDGAFRITYHIKNNTIFLRRCGTHQIYKNP
ncbi:MAG: cytotoxin [Candidatus Marinimicrobia bacterium]|nr:cytotoxin [Candidatus Neomarinimicrobiota bacterium]